ncbi:MAG: anthranilate phosphoribosyltransferase [Arenicella sp.]|jgi:anthranilate phosphoribosyltransferase
MMKLAPLKNGPDDLIRDVIRRIAVGPDRGRDISAAEAEQVMTEILTDQVDPIQAALFLIGLRMKRESMGEFQGIFRALQDAIEPQAAAVEQLICLADPYDGYLRYVPASPFVPSILAACGLPALICGVETVGPKHGVTAHKIYKLAGINPLNDTKSAIANIENHGWAYLDQSQYAPELFLLGEFRDRIVKRTALTTLERLLMPIQASHKTHMVLGYVHKAYPEIYSSIAAMAGYSSALLSKGLEGGFVPALNKPIRQFQFDFDAPDWAFTEKKLFDVPPQLASVDAAPSVLSCANQDTNLAAENCLKLGLEALAGTHNSLRNSLIVASAQIIGIHQAADNFYSAVDKVQNCLDNGSAQDSFRSLVVN